MPSCAPPPMPAPQPSFPQLNHQMNNKSQMSNCVTPCMMRAWASSHSVNDILGFRAPTQPMSQSAPMPMPCEPMNNPHQISQNYNMNYYGMKQTVQPMYLQS
jgi:hypothetical protein